MQRTPEGAEFERILREDETMNVLVAAWNSILPKTEPGTKPLEQATDVVGHLVAIHSCRKMMELAERESLERIAERRGGDAAAELRFLRGAMSTARELAVKCWQATR